MLRLQFLGLSLALPELLDCSDGVRGTLSSWTEPDLFHFLQQQQAINIALAFCMGTDLTALTSADQPMALIFFNSFGQKPTLAIWAFVVLTQ
jgi:hypothetical protein